MNYLAFILTMPNRASWNGRWSGDGQLFAVVQKFSKSSKTFERIKNRNFYYRWSDGWGANVEVKEITGQDSRQIKRRSKGFCGYDWMIESILQHDGIYAAYANHEKPEEQKVEAP